MDTAQPTSQRTEFIGRVQEQRQFLVALQGLLTHHQRWLDAQQTLGPAFDPEQAPPDDSYACIFLLHGIGGIGKSWLAQRCLALATEIPYEPPLLTLYDDVSLGSPVLEAGHLLDRLVGQLAAAGYEAELIPYRQAKTDTPGVVERVLRYQFENREQWETHLVEARGLLARQPDITAHQSFAETSLAYIHTSGAESPGTDAATLAQAYDLLLAEMEAAGKIEPAEAALFRNPPAAQATRLVQGLQAIAAQRPLVIGLDNLEIVVNLEPLIRDCLVMPTNQAPIVWILSGRYNLADERLVELQGEQRVHKGFRDLLGDNPPIVWDMSIFGDADLRDYLQAEAERRRAAVVIDDDLIEAVKATSSGVPLVVEMVADALFTMDRSEFMRDFALLDRSLLPDDRLERITARFLRYCLTEPRDLERVQGMALLRKDADEVALAAVWELGRDQSVYRVLADLRTRYAFVRSDGLHDAVYDFVRRQLRTDAEQRQIRARLARRAEAYYRPGWNGLHDRLDEPSLRVHNSDWQRITRDLLNALLWAAPDEAVMFLLPRFIEGLGFDRPFANGLLRQAEEFLAGSEHTFSDSYVTLLRRLRIGMQDIDWQFEEPGEAVGSMITALLEMPDLAPLHVAILELWRGNWLVESGDYEAGLAAYLTADRQRPAEALNLGRQLGRAFYELSSRFLWPESGQEIVPSEPGLQAAQRAVQLDPQNGGAWFNLGVALDYLEREEEAVSAYERAIEIAPQPAHYYHLGEVYSALGQNEAAVAAYQQAISLDPDYAWPYHGLALILAGRGEYEVAAERYQQAIERHQNDRDRAVSWDDFGDVQAVRGDYEEAISAYRWATVLDSDYAPPWLGLGNVYGAQGNYQGAVEAYQQAIGLDPDYAGAYQHLATIYVRQEKYADAVTAYQQALDRQADEAAQAESWRGLGDVHRLQERYLDAVEAYRQAIRLDPDQGQALNDLGDVYRALGQFDSALAAYERAVELEPELVAAWNSLANLHGADQQFDEASQAYQRVIKLAPERAWPYNNLGFIYSRQGQYEAAIELYQQAIERHPADEDRAVSWSNLGDVYLALGQPEAAERAYRQAMGLAPAYAWPYHNLARLSEQQGVDESALELYQQAVARHVDEASQARSLSNLAELYRRLAQPREAVQAYQQVVDLTPDDAEAWDNLGDVCLALDQTEAAERAYRRALALDPDYAWPYHNLGRLAADRGDQEAALRFFQQAIERQLDDPARARSWHQLGMVHLALEMPEEAARAYRQAIKLDSIYANPYQELAQIYRSRGEVEAAAGFYRQALARYPEEARIEQARSWYGLGEAYQAMERSEMAVDAYEQATRLDPDYADPWPNLGDSYGHLGRVPEAIAAYRRAIELLPAQPRIHDHLARLLVRRGDYETAIPLYQAAIDRYEPAQERGATWRRLGDAYQAQSRSESAREAYGQAVALNEADVEAWQRLGEILVNLEQPQAALEAYRRLVDLAPERVEAWQRLGDILAEADESEEAEAAYRQAIALDQEYAWPYHRLGQLGEARGDYEAAGRLFQQAIERHTEEDARAQAWYRLGRVYQAQQQPQPAMRAHRQAIELDPSQAGPYYQLGELYSQQKQPEAAASFYQRALRHYPAAQAAERAQAWDKLGQAYSQSGREAEALEAYQAALALDEQFARPWQGLGDVYRRQGQSEAAIEAYRRAIALDPAEAWSYNNLGLVYQALGDEDEALSLYQQALERHTARADEAMTHHNLGDIYRNRRQYHEAIKAYQQAIDLDPDLAGPWNGLGEVYQAQGREQGVVEAFRRAIELDPAAPWPYHNLGRLYRQQGASRQAASYYQQAIKRQGPEQDQAASWSGLGDVYRDWDRDDQAIEAYQRAIELDPDAPWPYHNLGFIHKNQGHYQRAITLYRQALDRFGAEPVAAVAWNNLGNVYSRLDRDEAAVEAYRQAVELEPGYALAWNSLGESYGHLQQPEEAIAAYQEAIKHDPEFVLAWHNLGEIYSQQKRYNKTIEAYERAIELDPDYAWPYHQLGQLYEDRGDYESAISYYQQAIERHQNPEHKAILWDTSGNIYRLMGAESEATEAFQRATGFDPKYAAPWYSLGIIYATQDRDEAAINAFRQAIELNPDDPWPYHSLALVYEKLESYGQSVALYQQAIDHHRHDRDRAVSWDSQGNVLAELGRFEGAIQAFKEAIRLNPDYAVAWNSLGDVYSFLNRRAEAIEAYQQAIELAPDYARPYQNLGTEYEKKGEYEQAIAVYKDIIDRPIGDYERAIVWSSLGDIYGLLERQEEAIAAYEEAIRLDPNYTWSYNGLGAIYEKRGERDQAYALYREATRRHRQQSLVTN